MNPLSMIIQQVIDIFFKVTGDYGFAIVGVTLVFKLMMLPFNLKMRKSSKKQLELSRKMEEIKTKYKNNKEKMDKELQELISKEGTGSLGCLLAFLQIPIMFSLYQVIRGGMKEELSTVLLPWVSSLLVSDPYYIVPTLAVIVQALPQFFPYLKIFKSLNLPKQNIGMAIMMSCLSGWIFFFVPSGVGLYYLVSGIFNLIEQTVANIMELRKVRTAQLAHS